MDKDNERVALVTGVDGLGHAVAVELARRQWAVCCQAAEAEDAEAAVDAARDAAAVAGHDTRVEPLTADLEDGEQREQLIESMIESFGRVDLLVCAPVTAPLRTSDLLELGEKELRAALDASVVATTMLAQLVAREMVRLAEAGLAENPRIVTINSIGAYTTSADHAPHCLARSALAMLTKLLADRLGEYGINAYEVRVGMIRSGATDPEHEEYDELIEQGLMPIRRWGRPADVARAVAAVAEDLLPFSTGEVINVDGGFHLRRM